MRSLLMFFAMTTADKEWNGFSSSNLSAYSFIRCSLNGMVKTS